MANKHTKSPQGNAKCLDATSTIIRLAKIKSDQVLVRVWGNILIITAD